MRVYSAYSRLPESAKKKVQRYGILTAAVGVINTLKADKAEAERQAEEARKLAELEEQRSTEENTGYGIVYWTPKGKSYHSREAALRFPDPKRFCLVPFQKLKIPGMGIPVISVQEAPEIRSFRGRRKAVCSRDVRMTA